MECGRALDPSCDAVHFAGLEGGENENSDQLSDENCRTKSCRQNFVIFFPNQIVLQIFDDFLAEKLTDFGALKCNCALAGFKLKNFVFHKTNLFLIYCRICHFSTPVNAECKKTVTKVEFFIHQN